MRVTIKSLTEILKRLDRCENMAQVCWIFDTLPKPVKNLIEAEDNNHE